MKEYLSAKSYFLFWWQKNSNSKTKITVLKSFCLSSRATYHLLPITLKGQDLFPTHTEKVKTIKNLVIKTNHQSLQENHRIEKYKSEETCSSMIFWEGKNSPVSGCSWESPAWLPALTQRPTWSVIIVPGDVTFSSGLHRHPCMKRTYQHTGKTPIYIK